MDAQAQWRWHGPPVSGAENPNHACAIRESDGEYPFANPPEATPTTPKHQ